VVKIQIEEVEEILNSSGLLALLAPKHVFITDEEIVQHMGQEVVHFRGVAPRNRRGIMVLSKAADVTTVPHEWIHSALGLGEAIAYPFGSLYAKLYEVKKRFKFLSERPRIFKVKYAKGSTPEKYKGRVKHYVKVVV